MQRHITIKLNISKLLALVTDMERAIMGVDKEVAKIIMTVMRPISRYITVLRSSP